MPITDPDHWKEPYWDQGPKYDKILEILAELNKHTLNVQFFYGTFVEKFHAVVTSNGTTATMSLELAGGGDLTMVFSDGHTALDTTPAVTIPLTAGSDSSPQGNWIYIPLSTKVLTKSTTAWPSAEHIKVGYFLVPSATFVQNNGAYVNQNWNDGTDITIKQGHLSDITMRIRRSGALFFSGVVGNGNNDYLDIPSAGNVHWKSTAGIVSQMHPHIFQAHDTSGSDLILVKNESGNAFNDGANLYTLITNDSTGSAIGLNKYFNLVFWGVVNKSGEFDTIICNLPGGTYSTQNQAENDVSGFDDFSIPREFSIDSSTGFLICRMTIQNVVGTWTHISTVDLRGTTPASATGGAGAITNEFADNVFRIQDESDPTKQIAFEASGITPATTRTLTSPDNSGIIALIADLHAEIHTMASHSDDDTYDINTSGTADVGALTPTSIILGATITDIDTAMPASPTDGQLLTSQGIDEHLREKQPMVISNQWRLANGAIMNVLFGHSVMELPNDDSNANAAVTYHIPSYWKEATAKTVSVHVRYLISNGDLYSVKWAASALDDGENYVTEGRNIWNQVPDDFPAGTANVVYTKTRTLTDSNFSPGGSFGLRIESDALNTGRLFILEAWLTQAP